MTHDTRNINQYVTKSIIVISTEVEKSFEATKVFAKKIYTT